MVDNEKEPQKPYEKNGEETPASLSESSKEGELTEVTISAEELENLKKEVNEYKDKYLRLLADIENMRKRMQKERQEMTQYAIENVISEFLAPLDNLENALKFAQQMSDEVKNWASGFQMILSQFKDVLTNQGVTPVATEGKTFDPHAHEAVEIVETADKPPGTIIEEYVRGYKMGDRTIRPARVKVAKALGDKQKSDQQENQEKEK